MTPNVEPRTPFSLGQVRKTNLPDAPESIGMPRSINQISSRELDTDLLPTNYLQQLANKAIRDAEDGSAEDVLTGIYRNAPTLTEDQRISLQEWVYQYGRQAPQSKKQAFTVTIPPDIVGRIKKSGFPMFAIPAAMTGSAILGSEKGKGTR